MTKKIPFIVLALLFLSQPAAFPGAVSNPFSSLGELQLCPTVSELDGSPQVFCPDILVSNGALTDNGDGTVTLTTGVGGGGDVSSNTTTSVDGEVVLFSGTGGKTIKRATGTGIAKLASGVLSVVSKLSYSDFNWSSITGFGDGKVLRVNGTDANWSDINDLELDPVVGAINGIVKANGAGTISAAAAGTDYVVPAGNVATATALAANGSNCSSGSVAGGVDASGAAEACIDPIVSTEIDTSAELAGILTDETGSGGGFVRATSPTVTNPTANQAANGDTVLTSTRATDTGPTGNFLDFKNAAGTTVFKVTIGGAISTGSWTATAIGAAYGGTGIDTSGSTGVPKIAAGTWSVGAGIGDLASSTSANLASTLSDEIGSGKAVFGTALTGNGANIATSTGTLTSGNCVKIDANGNFVDHGSACGGSGTPGGSNTQLQYNNGGSFGGMAGTNWDNISKVLKFTDPTMGVNWDSINYVKVPDLAYNASTWNGSTDAVTRNGIRDWLESSQWVQSGMFNWSSVPNTTIPRIKVNWSTFWTDETSGINWDSIPGSTIGYTLKRTATGINWQSDLNTGGGSGAKIIQLNPYSAKITGAFVTATITGLDTASQGAQIDGGDGNWRVLFDATTDEAAVFYGVIPDNYTSTPVIKLMVSANSATTGKVEWEAAVMCVTPGDSADVGTASFASGATDGGVTVPGTAGYTQLTSITPTDDSCSAGDLIYVYVSTDANDATNDDATGDRELVGAYVSYT